MQQELEPMYKFIKEVEDWYSHNPGSLIPTSKLNDLVLAHKEMLVSKYNDDIEKLAEDWLSHNPGFHIPTSKLNDLVLAHKEMLVYKYDDDIHKLESKHKKDLKKLQEFYISYFTNFEEKPLSIDGRTFVVKMRLEPE